MKIKLSSIITVVAVILLLVLTWGVVSNLLPNVYLSTPKISVKKYGLEQDGTGYDPVIQISSVKGATKYEIYVDGDYRGSTVTTTFEARAFLNESELGHGPVEVCVRAVRETKDETVLSELSNIIEANCPAG